MKLSDLTILDLEGFYSKATKDYIHDWYSNGAGKGSQSSQIALDAARGGDYTVTGILVRGSDSYTVTERLVRRSDDVLAAESFQRRLGEYTKHFERRLLDFYGGFETVTSTRLVRDVALLAPDRSRVELHASCDVGHLESVGWTKIGSLACEACKGVGTINGGDVLAL